MHIVERRRKHFPPDLSIMVSQTQTYNEMYERSPAYAEAYWRFIERIWVQECNMEISGFYELAERADTIVRDMHYEIEELISVG